METQYLMVANEVLQAETSCIKVEAECQINKGGLNGVHILQDVKAVLKIQKQ